MAQTKPHFVAFIAVAIFISAGLVGWAWWNAVRWLNVPTPGAQTNAPLAKVVVPPIPSAQPSVEHQATVEDFLGTWTGKWDDSYAAHFNITRGRGQSLVVVYECEQPAGRPAERRILHPTPNGRVLRMPRASLVLTLMQQPNTARADGNFSMSDGYHHTAALTRTDIAVSANWPFAQALSGPSTRPITLDIKATIDGADVLHLWKDRAVWEHKDFQLPDDVSMNDVPWDVAAEPMLSKTGFDSADFSTAKVLSRSGRDLVAMEQIPNGIEIYFDDGPAGSAPYEIQISMNRKGTTRPATTQPTGKPIFLDVTANIDGSDILAITPKSAQWVHRDANWPTDVQINGAPWNIQATPTINDVGLAGADFSTAQVVERTGRGALVMEPAANGITVYFDDPQPDADRYHIRIRFEPK